VHWRINHRNKKLTPDRKVDVGFQASSSRRRKSKSVNENDFVNRVRRGGEPLNCPQCGVQVNNLDQHTFLKHPKRSPAPAAAAVAGGPDRAPKRQRVNQDDQVFLEKVNSIYVKKLIMDCLAKKTENHTSPEEESKRFIDELKSIKSEPPDKDVRTNVLENATTESLPDDDPIFTSLKSTIRERNYDKLKQDLENYKAAGLPMSKLVNQLSRILIELEVRDRSELTDRLSGWSNGGKAATAAAAVGNSNNLSELALVMSNALAVIKKDIVKSEFITMSDIKTEPPPSPPPPPSGHFDNVQQYGNVARNNTDMSVLASCISTDVTI